MDTALIRYFPKQVAMILGKDITDVLRWIDSGALKSDMKYGRPWSSQQDIAEFLNEHPEEIGRVYCDDLIPFFNQARSNIVAKLENLNEVSNLWQDCRSTRLQSS